MYISDDHLMKKHFSLSFFVTVSPLTNAAWKVM